MNRTSWRAWMAAAALGTSVLTTGDAAASSLRFYGNGVAAPDLDRVKIPVDDVGDSLPGPPADLGDTDFTIEFWMKGSAVDNTAGAVSCGDNINWIYGNIVLDRDRYSQGRKFGLSLADGRLVFGVSTETADRTVCGSTTVLDDLWHHVAVTRDASTGDLALWVDGAADGSSTGPVGDLSYPDDGVPCSNCCGGGNCNFSDPFLVLGAEKHDAGGSFPSYSGFLDELRLSDQIRYAAPFAPSTSAFTGDASTLALYHFDEGSGDAIGDSSGHPDGPSDGERRFGGSPAGPEWVSDTPFGDPGDLDGDGKLNGQDECTVLVSAQVLSRSSLVIQKIDDGALAQKLSWKGDFRPASGAPVDPVANGVHLRLADSGGTLLDLNVPAGAVGASPSTPCDPRDGWTTKGSPTSSKYSYRNYSGFLDAACTVPAGGLSQIKLTDSTQTSAARVRFRVKGRDMTLAVASSPTLLEASLALAVQPSPGVASAVAEAGGCGDHSWNPISFVKPKPFCKARPSAAAPSRLQCRTL